MSDVPVKRGPIKPQCLEILRQREVPVGTVLDVGVQYGTPELMQAWPNVPHLLFEPVEEFVEPIERLYRNLDHELIKAAVGSSSGETYLEVMQVLENMSVSHSHMVSEKGERPVRTVRKISLDDFLRDRSDAKPYLLKIDIDGHEMEVLRGAAETLKSCSIVIIETPVHHIQERLKAVEDAGFLLFDLIEPCYYDDALWQCDAVFLRRDIHASHFTSLKAGFKQSLWSRFGA